VKSSKNNSGKSRGDGAVPAGQAPRDGKVAGKSRKEREETDAALWRHVTKSVTPLEKEIHIGPALSGRQKSGISGPDADSGPDSSPDSSLGPIPDLTPGGGANAGRRGPAAAPLNVPPVYEQGGDKSAGIQAGVDRRTEERLKKGRMQIEARLDLHGMTQVQAHAALADFTERCQRAGMRCVLVITGKGGSGKDRSGKDRPDKGGRLPGDGPGILRRAVPEWLRQPPNGPRVLRFFPAKPRDGGEGALYVLLRRERRHRDGPG